MGDANKRKEKGKKGGREVTLRGSEFMDAGHKPQPAWRLAQ